VISLEVSGEDAGQRLDAYLAPSVGSRSSAERLIASGHVRVDGVARPKRHMVSAGERIEVDERAAASPRPTSGATLPFDVAYEDEHLLVIDKPAGMVVQSRRWGGPGASRHRAPARP